VNFSANNGPPGDPNTDGTDRVRRKLKMPYRTAGDVRTNPPTARHVMFFQNSCNKYDAAYGTPRNPNLNPDLGSYSDPENLPLPGPDASDAEKADWRRCKESARTVHQALKEQLTPYVTLEPDPGTCGVRGTDIDRARQYARSVWRLEHYAVFSNVKFWGPTNESDHGTKSCPTPKLAADFAAQVWEELKQYNRTPGAGCQPAPDVPSHPVGCHLVAGEFSNDTKFAVQGTPGSEDYNKAYIKHMKDNKDKVHVFALHDYYDVIFNNTAKYYPASRSNPSQSFVQVREFGKLIKDKYPGAKIWLSEQGVLLTGKGQGLQVDGQHQIDAANRFLEIGQEDPRVNLVNYYEFFGCSQDPSKRRNCNTNFDSGLVRNPPDPPNPEIQRPPYSFGGFRAAYCRLAQRPKNTCYQGPGL
jgi:hypothetical protein